MPLGAVLWIKSPRFPYPLVSSWVWPTKGSSRSQGGKRKSLKYLFPLIYFLLGHWSAVAAFLTSYPLLQLSSLKVPETTPSPAPSGLTMIMTLGPQVFHQALLVFLDPRQSHCWYKPGDNWYTQQTTFSLSASIFPGGSYLHLVQSTVFLSVIVFCMFPHVKWFNSLQKSLHPRVIPNSATNVYKLCVILDQAKSN